MRQSILTFHENETTLTLGVELELQVLDVNNLLLSPRAHEIIDNVQADKSKVKHEFFQSTLEVITGICNNVHEAKADLTKTLAQVKSIAGQLNLKLSSTGTHPEADYRDRLITPSKRYHELMDRNQWIIRRMAVYGMHIHIGMATGESCIAFQNFFLHFVPHMLALSASSPFWQKMHTGLACTRPTMYEAMPTSGMPHIVKNWIGFEKMYRHLVRSKSIKSIHDLWLDLRPSPQFGTLEIRICDEPATLTEAMAIVAFVHTLAHWYEENHKAWELTHKKLYPWIFRENKWRAIRYGLHGELIQSHTRQTVSIQDHMTDWVELLNPYVRKLGYENYFETLENILNRGNSADRQLAVFQQSENLHDVVLNNVLEFEENTPNWKA